MQQGLHQDVQAGAHQGNAQAHRPRKGGQSLHETVAQHNAAAGSHMQVYLQQGVQRGSDAAAGVAAQRVGRGHAIHGRGLHIEKVAILGALQRDLAH